MGLPHTLKHNKEITYSTQVLDEEGEGGEGGEEKVFHIFFNFFLKLLFLFLISNQDKEWG